MLKTDKDIQVKKKKKVIRTKDFCVKKLLNKN